MHILFISQQLEKNKNVLGGGDVCSKSLYQSFCLAVGKNNVKLICIPQEQKIYKRYIQYLFLRNMYTKKQEKQIVKEINDVEYDLIVLDGSWFGRILTSIAKKKVVLFLHNIEIDYSLQRYKKNCLTFLKLNSVRKNEMYAVKSADYICVLNNRDEKLLQKYYGRKADLLLPIVLEDKYSEHEQEYKEKEDYLLFVGSYFTPNIEGIKWFIQNVMPYIHVKLVVAGKNMEHLKKLENSNVKIFGTVEDLSEIYVNAMAVVLPIFSGGGMKVKTAEALMYGKKIYATNEALQGYEIEGISSICECNSSEEFIENINKEQEKRKFYSENRELFLKKYEQKNRNKAVEEFLLDKFQE